MEERFAVKIKNKTSTREACLGQTMDTQSVFVPITWSASVQATKERTPLVVFTVSCLLATRLSVQALGALLLPCRKSSSQHDRGGRKGNTQASSGIIATRPASLPPKFRKPFFSPTAQVRKRGNSPHDRCWARCIAQTLMKPLTPQEVITSLFRFGAGYSEVCLHLTSYKMVDLNSVLGSLSIHPCSLPMPPPPVGW